MVAVPDRWSDRELVDALLKGDPKAVEFFVGEGCCASIIGALSRRFGLEYEELGQDLAVHLMERDWLPLRQWKGLSSLRTYVWSIANHLCLLHCRKMKREPVKHTLNDGDDWWGELEDASQFDPRRIAEGKESLAALLRSIEQLQETRDRLILYKVLGDASIEEIAKAFELLPAAARTAKFRALQRLHEMWGGQDDA